MSADDQPRSTTNGRRVLVDADACPRAALAAIRAARAEQRFELITVSNFHHDHSGRGADGITHITVSDEPQAVDLAILNETRPGDVVVTQDWGLASIALAKGAKALTPRGMIFRREEVDALLEARHFLAKVRRAGGRTKGPPPFSREDRDRFSAAFRKLLIEE